MSFAHILTVTGSCHSETASELGKRPYCLSTGKRWVVWRPEKKSDRGRHAILPSRRSQAPAFIMMTGDTEMRVLQNMRPTLRTKGMKPFVKLLCERGSRKKSPWSSQFTVLPYLFCIVTQYAWASVSHS